MEYISMFFVVFLSCFATIMYLVTIYKVFEISDNLRKLMAHQGMQYTKGTPKGIIFALALIISAIIAAFSSVAPWWLG